MHEIKGGAMPSMIDFRLAARRHWNDATLLDDHGRTGNAGQLYGLSAECGVKALLVALGYPTEPDGSPANEPPAGLSKVRSHIHQFVSKMGDIQGEINGRGGAKYTAMFPNITKFSDWTTDHRYWANSAIPNSLPASKLASEEVMRMLDTASLDGVLK